MAKLSFQQPLHHMILQKSFQYVSLLLKKHFLLLSVFQTVILLCFFFVETTIDFFKIPFIIAE